MYQKYIKFSFKINSKFTLTIGHDHICATTFALYIYDNGRLLRGGARYKQPVVTDILTASSVLVIYWMMRAVVPDSPFLNMLPLVTGIILKIHSTIFTRYVRYRLLQTGIFSKIGIYMPYDCFQLVTIHHLMYLFPCTCFECCLPMYVQHKNIVEFHYVVRIHRSYNCLRMVITLLETQTTERRKITISLQLQW